MELRFAFLFPVSIIISSTGSEVAQFEGAARKILILDNMQLTLSRTPLSAIPVGHIYVLKDVYGKAGGRMTYLKCWF